MRYFRLVKPIPYLSLEADKRNGAIFGLDEGKVYLHGKVINWIHPSIFENDNEYFEQFTLFNHVGDRVRVVRGGTSAYGTVTIVDPFENLVTVRYDDKNKLEDFVLNSAWLKKLNLYWFINSKGSICQISEEKTEPATLTYRKSIGNYFKTFGEAKQYEVKIVKKENK